MSILLTQAALAAAETTVNRVLRMDATVQPQLQRLAGKVIAIDIRDWTRTLYILPSEDGLRLAAHFEADADCTLHAPAFELLRLMLSKDKSRILHGPTVDMDGDSQILMQLSDIMQNLDLDWEYELSQWLGPVATPLIGNGVRDASQWTRDSLHKLRLDLADFLTEESRTLVGKNEAEVRFAELDELKLALDRLEARIDHLSHKIKDA